MGVTMSAFLFAAIFVVWIAKRALKWWSPPRQASEMENCIDFILVARSVESAGKTTIFDGMSRAYHFHTEVCSVR
jgi:hypothetical protein